MMRLKKAWFRLLCGCVGYLVIACVFYGCADMLVMHPSRQPIPTPGQTRLSIPAPKGTLEVFSIQTPPALAARPEAFVLHFIGNGSRAEYECAVAAQEWENRPVEIWTVNYPGYGGSAGKAGLNSIPPASLAAYDALAQKAHGRPIFISGNSLGTTPALYVAANRATAGVFLRNPAPLRQLIIGHYGWWNLYLLALPVALAIPSELDSVANARHVSVPAIFLCSDKDEIIPPSYQREVISAYAGPKTIIHMPQGGHHTLTPPVCLQRLQTALKQLAPRAS